MADLSPAQRLAELRERWERDPKSRVFLQLAEEYRRAGRLAEAVRVLESGLAAHPGYVAAQVVLGRCLLETGDAPRAVGVLERAVASDPTQIVAIRLLVDAYLGIENVAKARERLDLYRLLNDRDAEIESLERRIGAMGGVMKPVAGRTRMSRDRSGEVAIQPAPSPVEVPLAVAPNVPEPPSFSPGIPPADEVVRPRAEQPFGRFRGAADAHRIVSAIAAAGIFPVSAPRPARARPPIVPRIEEIERPAPASAARVEETPDFTQELSSHLAAPSASFTPIEPDLELPDVFVLPSEPEPAEARDPQPFRFGNAAPERFSSIEAPPDRVATPPVNSGSSTPTISAGPGSESAIATATLGSLYLSQGHLDDAAHSFETVLDSRPDDPDALAGLAEVMRRKVAAAAAFLDEPPALPPSHAGAMVGGLTSRKIDVLRQFMTRMRRGSSLHVS